MGELLRILRAYVILAVLTAVGLVTYRIVETYWWMRMPEDNALMAPVLPAGRTFRVNKRAPAEERLQRGDVVAYVKDPRAAGSFLVGRIVALPGERVAIVKGEVRINGERLAEPGLPTPTEGEVAEIVVPRGHFFVLVDARNEAVFREGGDADSRGLGPISAARLMGKVLL